MRRRSGCSERESRHHRRRCGRANALQIALGLGAHCTILDVRPEILTEIENSYGNAVITLLSNEWNIAHAIKDADVVIGAVLIPGRKAPTLVTEEMVKSMQPGSVIVDIAVDQGASLKPKTVRPHTMIRFMNGMASALRGAEHAGAVPRTATIALTNATLPYAVEIANQGARQAAANNPTIQTGFNVHSGKLTNKDVAESIGESILQSKLCCERHRISEISNRKSGFCIEFVNAHLYLSGWFTILFVRTYTEGEHAMKTKYQVIADEIRSKILSNEFVVGKVIPPELQLQKDYGVSRHTVREAIALLVNEGFLRKEKGSGT